MKKEKYDLTFYEALEVVLNGGAVKGSDFMDGIFLRLNKSGQLVTVDAARLYEESTWVSIKALSLQKYRSLMMMTIKELSN